MGIPPSEITPQMYRRLDAETQGRYKQIVERIGEIKRLPDPGSKAHLRYERDHQGRVVQLCKQQGIICGWAATHRRSTYTKGWPDLTIVHGGKALLIELKAQGGLLSADQWDLYVAFGASGTEVKICFSDAEAWVTICDWMKANFNWSPSTS